jgi:hypothetical protein
MTATTTAYLELQHVYREQADADVAAVEAHAGRILAAQGRSPTAIPHAAVRSFCKNARNIRWALPAVKPAERRVLRGSRHVQMKVSCGNTGCCATAHWQTRSAPRMATPAFAV